MFLNYEVPSGVQLCLKCADAKNCVFVVVLLTIKDILINVL
jgi:hypothetical protein